LQAGTVLVRGTAPHCYTGIEVFAYSMLLETFGSVDN
jgi:hypothetical protein